MTDNISNLQSCERILPPNSLKIDAKKIVTKTIVVELGPNITSKGIRLSKQE